MSISLKGLGQDLTKLVGKGSAVSKAVTQGAAVVTSDLGVGVNALVGKTVVASSGNLNAGNKASVVKADNSNVTKAIGKVADTVVAGVLTATTGVGGAAYLAAIGAVNQIAPAQTLNKNVVPASGNATPLNSSGGSAALPGDNSNAILVNGATVLMPPVATTVSSVPAVASTSSNIFLYIAGGLIVLFLLFKKK